MPAGTPIPPEGAADLLPGVVVAAYRRHYDVALDAGATIACVLKGRSMQLACGDNVRVRQHAEGGAIESVVDRATLLYRSDGVREKLLAANVTQIVGVVAPDITVDEELIQRWIIAAEAQRCRFVLVANKSDLPGFASFRARLTPVAELGYPVVDLAAARDAAPILPWLAHQRSVLVGQSGMGKSTLINAFVPNAQARTGEISTSLSTGRHTTSATSLYRAPAFGDDGWIVDSPGMKAFGLAHLTPQAIAGAFVELRGLGDPCRFRDCRHDQEPGCAVRAAVAQGRVSAHRVALMHALIAESARVRPAGSAGN
jgi:ribosome biogenesis GTPase